MVRIEQESFPSPSLGRAGRPAHMNCWLEVLCTKLKWSAKWVPATRKLLHLNWGPVVPRSRWRQCGNKTLQCQDAEGKSTYRDTWRTVHFSRWILSCMWTSCTFQRHARWCHDLRISFIIQKLMKTNMYLQCRIEIDATLCELMIGVPSHGIIPRSPLRDPPTVLTPKWIYIQIYQKKIYILKFYRNIYIYIYWNFRKNYKNYQ